MDKARSLLTEVFGYDCFRPLQEEIIKTVLAKKDALVVMPTGGGKSLCYQLPALIFNGLTIVISPLISLMKDQVEQLRQSGVETAILNSSLTREEYNTNFNKVRSSKAKLLYLAPESLVKEDILSLFNENPPDCITVDEAHCISEWGHDFRPEYRQLGALRKKFSSAVCIALTATATPVVQDDIIKNLKLINASRFTASFNRENLFLRVIPKRNALQQTIDFLHDHKDQAGIIYCFSRRQVDDLVEDLKYSGFSALPYHAGLSDSERHRNQELFIKDEVQIICATIAFGMGINKSNVRFVIHYDLPKNPESYYQEIGRAGRDGLQADCLLLFSYGDISKINYFILQKEDEKQRIAARNFLNAMVKYAETEQCRRISLINYFGEKYDKPVCGMCDNCTEDEKELSDITVPAQKFLSAVKRTREIYGMNYIIDVLTAADNERIINNQHNKLTVFGIGKEFTKKQWYFLGEQLVNKKLLERDTEFGSLKLNEPAYKVLLKNEKVFGKLREPDVKSKKTKSSITACDMELFELLRRKRKELADNNNIAPYVIFSDKSLVQMAIDYPVTELEFLNIGGVGAAKLKSYGSIFISLISGYCSRKNISKQNISTPKVAGITRSTEIALLFNEGMSVRQLAERYNIKTATIIRYFERAAGEGIKLRTDGIRELIEAGTDLQEKAINEFRQNDSLSLKPVFDKLNSEVSYTDLHLLRLIYLSKDN